MKRTTPGDMKGTLEMTRTPNPDITKKGWLEMTKKEGAQTRRRQKGYEKTR